MMILCWALVVHLIFGCLLMDYLCPYWHPFEKLVGAAIWPVSLAVGIGFMVRETRLERQLRAHNAHTVFHLKAQIRHLDYLDYSEWRGP